MIQGIAVWIETSDFLCCLCFEGGGGVTMILACELGSDRNPCLGLRLWRIMAYEFQGLCNLCNLLDLIFFGVVGLSRGQACWMRIMEGSPKWVHRQDTYGIL